MIKTLFFENYLPNKVLEQTTLMKTLGGRIELSLDKPNVIVGANGCGKSTLLAAIGYLTMSDMTGMSCLSYKYASPFDADHLWTGNTNTSYGTWEYLKGLTADTDHAPAVFYVPGAIPGHAKFAAEAMMKGFSVEAREHSAKTKNKSSGEASQALLEKALQVMKSGELAYIEKDFELVHRELATVPRHPFTPQSEYKMQVLLNQRVPHGKTLPMVVMDEPERSLDTRAELQLWKQIEGADPGLSQILVATHSLYPLMHPDKFNLIEANPGYIEEVLALI